jgi:hypothetical protein
MKSRLALSSVQTPAKPFSGEKAGRKELLEYATQASFPEASVTCMHITFTSIFRLTFIIREHIRLDTAI